MNLIAYDGQIELEEDDWLEADERDGPSDPDDYLDDEDEWGCEFGPDCVIPHYFHRRSECYTADMAQAWEEEHKR